MARPITIRIDLAKVAKEHIYAGKNGAKYLNIAIFPNRDGESQYGDTHYCVQDIPKEARDAGIKGNIIGNMKMPSDDQSQRSSSPDRGFSRPSGGRDYPLKEREPNGRQKAPVDDNEPFDF